MAKVKDVKGTISRITSPASKTFTAKKGKTAGKTFTIWSIGVQLDNGEWYNIKGKSSDKVTEVLQIKTLQRNFAVGDEVKLYLEPEDAAAKYWKIVSIAISSPMDDISVEDVVDGEPVEEEIEPTEEDLAEAAKEADKQYNVKPIGEQKKEDPKKAEEKPKEEPKEEATQTTVAPSEPKPAPKKDMAKVDSFKTQEADKYELGMAKNNAAIIFASLIRATTAEGIDELKELIKENNEYYDKLTVSLFNRGKEIRKKILGY